MNRPSSDTHAEVQGAPREYRARSSAAIPEGLVAPIPYRLPQACRVIDVVCPEGFSVTRVAFGKQTVEVAAGERVAEKLRAEPYESAAPSFVIVTVKNETPDARVAEIAIVVTGEHGPIGGPSPFTPSARSSGAYAVDEDGGPMPFRPTPSRPDAPGVPLPKERLPSGFVESVRRAPVPPPVPSPSASKKTREKQTYERWRDRNRPPKVKKRVTGTGSSDRAGAARSNAPPVITVYAESVTTHDSPQQARASAPPIDTSQITSASFFHAHAVALLSALERGVPVPRDCRSTIVLAFAKAADGDEPSSRNQLTVFLSRDLARDFGAAVRIYEEHRSGSRGDAVRDLLANALGRSTASAPEPQTPASDSGDSPDESPRHTALATVLPLNPRHASDDSRSEPTDGEDHHVP